MSESVREMFEQLDQQIEQAILDLLRKRIEWSRKEIEILASVTQRLADRAQRAVDELDFYVERIWSPKLIARRWGRSLPKVDRPIILINYPGKYTGTDYDEVVVLQSPLGNNITIKIPALPFRDIMRTDPRLEYINLEHLLSQLHGIKIFMPREYKVEKWISIGGSVMVSKEMGKTVIGLRPKTFLVKNPWQSTKCVAGVNSDLCLSPEPGYFVGDGASYKIELNSVRSSILSIVKAVLVIDGEEKELHAALGIADAFVNVYQYVQGAWAYLGADRCGIVCVEVTSSILLDGVHILLAASSIPLSPIAGKVPGACFKKCLYSYKYGARHVIIPVEAVWI